MISSINTNTWLCTVSLIASDVSLNRRFMILLIIGNGHNGWWWRAMVMVMTITKMMTNYSCVVSSRSLFLAIITTSLNSRTTLDVRYFGKSLLGWKLLPKPVMTQFTDAYLTDQNSVKFLLVTSGIYPCHWYRAQAHEGTHQTFEYTKILMKITEAHHVPQIHMAIYKTVLCHLGAWQVPLNFDLQTENVMRHPHLRSRPTPSRGLTYLTLQKQT